jgi:O-antigen/teichoic acid export membrane protein
MLQKIKQLKNHQGFRKYFANTSWLMGERILRMVVALFVGVYVARYLGPAQFGLLSYAGSFVGLFAALATLGLDSIVVRELVKTPERRDELLGTAFWLKIGGAILLWVAITAAIPMTNNDTQTNSLIAIIAFAAVFQAFNVINFNYQAEVKSKYVVHAQLVQLIISSITKLVFIAIEAPLIWFAWVFLLDAIVLAVGLVIIYLRKTGKIWYWQWKWQSAKELLQDSWPVILSIVSVSFYMQIDQVMINNMLDSKEVGLYAAAVTLSSAWHFIPIVITTSLLPAIINAKEHNKELYYQKLQKLHDLMVLLAVAVALPTTFLASWVVKLLYGVEYLQASEVLSIHIWSGVFVFLGIAGGRWYLVENLLILAFYRHLNGAVVNIIMNLYLIPRYGVIGAAISTLISYSVSCYIHDFFNKKTRCLFLIKTRTLCFIGMSSFFRK